MHNEYNRAMTRLAANQHFTEYSSSTEIFNSKSTVSELEEEAPTFHAQNSAIHIKAN